MKTNTAQTYSPETVLHFRDGNLRHPTRSMRVVRHVGDTVTVRHQSGVVGDWLSRDLYDPTCETVNSPARVGFTKPEVRNDCLGMGWEQIESAQGGKLTR